MYNPNLAYEVTQMVGQTISHYKILEKLGAGGMGVVYEAVDTRLERTVALKFVTGEIASDESARLVREAKACASLNHPNITTIYEFGESEGKSFIAMELVEGMTLQKLMKVKCLQLPEVLEISLQVVDGLIAAHKKGIFFEVLADSLETSLESGIMIADSWIN